MFETTKGNIDRFLSNLLMALLTEKQSYQSIDKKIEELLDISQDILNNKQIDHRFELSSNMGEIAKQKFYYTCKM